MDSRFKITSDQLLINKLYISVQKALNDYERNCSLLSSTPNDIKQLRAIYLKLENLYSHNSSSNKSDKVFVELTNLLLDEKTIAGTPSHSAISTLKTDFQKHVGIDLSSFDTLRGLDPNAYDTQTCIALYIVGREERIHQKKKNRGTEFVSALKELHDEGIKVSSADITHIAHSPLLQKDITRLANSNSLRMMIFENLLKAVNSEKLANHLIDAKEDRNFQNLLCYCSDSPKIVSDLYRKWIKENTLANKAAIVNAIITIYTFAKKKALPFETILATISRHPSPLLSLFALEAYSHKGVEGLRASKLVNELLRLSKIKTSAQKTTAVLEHIPELVEAELKHITELNRLQGNSFHCVMELLAVAQELQGAPISQPHLTDPQKNVGDIKKDSSCPTFPVSTATAQQKSSASPTKVSAPNMAIAPLLLPDTKMAGHVQKDRENTALIIMAARLNHQKALRTLIDSKRYHLDFKNENNETALIAATAMNHVDRVRDLLSSGANPDLQNHAGNTPLHIAAWHNSTEIARELIASKRANLDLKNQVGNTPLQLAILRNNKEIAGELIVAGADVGIEDKSGRTALDYAINTKNNLSTVALLLTHGIHNKKSAVRQYEEPSNSNTFRPTT